MSIWYEIKDKEDINLSDDGKSLQINFDGNDEGNIWVEVPLELIDQLRQPDVMPALPDGLDEDSNSDNNFILGWKACYKAITGNEA